MLKKMHYWYCKASIRGFKDVKYDIVIAFVRKYKKTKKRTKTKTMTQTKTKTTSQAKTKTKCFKKTTYAISFKRSGVKDIKYGMSS